MASSEEAMGRQTGVEVPPGPSPSPPPAERSEPVARRWWSLGARAAAALLAAVLALEVWALASTDPDFYLPDPFRPFAIGLILLFAATALLPWRRPRRAARTVALATVFAALALEAHIRFREGHEPRIELTSDVLLRYRYHPGHVESDPTGAEVRVNHLGLMDTEHAIPKPADVYRVVVLTGSIANDGMIPFRDRFFRRLEEDLAGAAGNRRIETINVSCEGYNTLQQVRLLEKVGLQYQPDAVVVAYMLTAASIQNGGYRRIGNSFFLFRFLPLLAQARTGSLCSLFAPFHERYTFDLIVRNSFERLALLSRQYGFRTLVAVLPVVERFDDPICTHIYDQVVATARESGLPAVRVADAFVGEPVLRFAKPNARMDLCHPNAEGHRRIASAIAAALRPIIAAPEPPAP